MIIRPLEQHDLVWLRPIAEKWGSWQDVEAIATDPDGYGVITALVVAPYTVGAMFHDDHGVVLEGLCDDAGIKQFIRLGEMMCQMADNTGINLHNHKWGEKEWYNRVLDRLGFVESGWIGVGHIRYAIQQAREVA